MSPDGTGPVSPRRRPSWGPAPEGSTAADPPPLSALASEASALLGQADLRRSDMRWLRGELLDVMISPLGDGASDVDPRILLTLVPRHERDGSLAELTVDCSVDDGPPTRCSLGSDGQAVVLVAAGSYRLRVRAPVELEPAAPAPAKVFGVVQSAGPGRSRPRLPARRRSARLTTTRPRPASGGRQVVSGAGLGVIALVVLGLFLNVLVLPGRNPAVAVVDITGRCRKEAAPKRPNHVVVAAVWSGTEKERFTEVLQQFRKKTGIHVTFATTTPDPDRNIGKTLTELTGNGCPPDVALLPQPGLLADLARDGLLEPVDAVTAGLVDRNYASAWKELGSYDHDLYGVWFKASNKSTVWYSTEAFARAGVAPPTTWSQLKDAATALSAAGITPFAVSGQDGWTLTDWFENVYLRTAGPDQYKRLADHQIPWTDPSVTNALRTMAEILGHPEWIAGGPAGARETTYEGAVRLVFGQPRRAAMLFAGDFVANEIAGTRTTVGEGARMFPFPSIGPGAGSTLVGQANRTGGGAAAGGDVAVLLKGATAAGTTLLRYLASPEAAEPWVKAGGFSSPNQRVDLELYRDEVDRRSAESLVSADISFDLSDLQPPRFGSTPGHGMGELLRTFLLDPTQADAIAAQLEAARREAGP